MKKIVVISLASMLTLSADPLVTYVGTKAKGMGGAFTAISNNNSAMYFNPAGLVNFEKRSSANFTIEGGQGAKYDEEATTSDKQFTSSSSYFVGISATTPKIGYGVALYTLYDLNLQDKKNQNAYYKEGISVLSLSGAYRLVDTIYPYGGAVSMGVTGAYAMSGSSDDSNSNDTLSVSGSFFMVGLKARLLNHRAFKIDVGANYRSYCKLESDDTSTVKYTGVGIPQEIAYGIAASYGTTFGLFTLAADHRDTGYEEATKNTDFTILIPDVSTTNIGFDFSTPSFQIRVGEYKSVYTNKSFNVRFPASDISGYTAGLGISFGENWNIEASYDSRTYKFSNEETTTPFISASLNYSFSSMTALVNAATRNIKNGKAK